MIGIIVAWAAAWGFIYETLTDASIFMRVLSVLVYPIHGFAVVLETILPDAVFMAMGSFVTVFLILFYPVIFTLIFWLAGERQTKKVIAAEACITACVIGLGSVSASMM